MKKLWSGCLLTAALCVLATLLAGCGEKSDIYLFSVRHTVSYYDADGLLLKTTVPDGEKAVGAPARDSAGEAVVYWLDEDGRFVRPENCVISADRRLTAWPIPALSRCPGAYLTVFGDCAQPDAAVTRGETADMLAKLLEPDGLLAARTSFSDLERDDPHRDAIATVCSHRLMSGYDDGSFRPDAYITRAEFAAVLARFTEPAQAGGALSDVPTNHWAAAAVAAVLREGWMSGYDDGSFRPDAPLSRAEAASALNRLVWGGTDKNAVAAACPEPVWADLTPEHWAYYDILQAGYRNELLSCILGEADGMEPGFTQLEGGMCHVNADTLCLDHYEAGFHTVDGGLYHCSQDGYFLDDFDKGVQHIDGHIYYAQEDGSLLTDGTVSYLSFGPDGRYTSGSEAIDAATDEILSGLDGTLYDTYCYVRDNTRYINWGDAYERGSHGWEPNCGEKVFQTGGGHCFYWAAEFLYLSRAMGFQSYAVIGGAGVQNKLHCWVMIKANGNWFICDPELEWTFSKGYYDGVPQTRDMYMQSRNSSQVLYCFPDGSYSYPYYWGSDSSIPAADDSSFIAVPEEPTTDPSAEPTGDSDDPTAQPTDPPTQPTDPPAQPTDPPSQPTDPPAQPTDPPAQPTDPPAQPTDPPAQPTDPPAQPTPPPPPEDPTEDGEPSA